MNSDEIVQWLQPYGVVRIHQHDDKTFRAIIKLYLEGISAEISSDFRHPSMYSALDDLWGRVRRSAVYGQAEAPMLGVEDRSKA